MKVIQKIYRRIIRTIIILFVSIFLSCSFLSVNQGPDVLKKDNKILGLGLGSLIDLSDPFPSFSSEVLLFGRYGLDGKSDIGIKIYTLAIFGWGLSIDYKYNIFKQKNFLISLFAGVGAFGGHEISPGDTDAFNLVIIPNFGIILGSQDVFFGVKLHSAINISDPDIIFYPGVFFGFRVGDKISILPEVGIAFLFINRYGNFRIDPALNIGISLDFKFE